MSELEEYEGLESGAVSVYETGKDGMMRLVDRKPSMGTNPCHLYLDEEERILYISNYGSGSACAYRSRGRRAFPGTGNGDTASGTFR